MSTIILNILDAIESNGESAVQEALSVFSCPHNAEVESFIRTNAIDFAKRKLSISYLVINDSNGQILGYYTLTHKAVDISGDNLSNTSKRKLAQHARYESDRDTYSASAFLLAQFGKNYSIDIDKRISGANLMEHAIDTLAYIQHWIGGGVVYLDAEDRPKLREFYENRIGYKLFGERFSDKESTKYLQYMRFM